MRRLFNPEILRAQRQGQQSQQHSEQNLYQVINLFNESYQFYHKQETQSDGMTGRIERRKQLLKIMINKYQ